LAEPQGTGATLWSVHSQDADYLGDAGRQFMLNYRVDGLEAVVAGLRVEGVIMELEISGSPRGRFPWIRDPEGRRIELWQGPPED
jgi:hypothetical protein